MTPYHHKLINLRLGGLSYKEIAAAERVSLHTVIYHFGNIYKNLGISRTAELAAAYYAYRKLKGLAPKEMLNDLFQSAPPRADGLRKVR